ncbi:MAG: DUF2807 domain-containing protein [Flavisolibacter sp.]|jgi:hypothetical protein|nr:DUF2807 domain-containing protein [Flavisolibacter sp.]
MLKILEIIFFSLFIISCKKELGSPGKIREETRTVNDFNKIVLHHKINLVLTQDTLNKLTIRTGENIIAGIHTNVVDDVLTIENSRNSSMNQPSQQIDVFLSAKELETIEYLGSGNISSTNTLKAPVFTVVSQTGAGVIQLDIEATHTVAGIYEESADIILSGKTNTAFVYCAPRGTINLKLLEAKKMNIYFSSVRNGYVWVTDELSGTNYHTGNILYKGNPVLQIITSGKGKFQPL